jgi:hypothetical protein
VQVFAAPAVGDVKVLVHIPRLASGARDGKRAAGADGQGPLRFAAAQTPLIN